jgi:sugar lactone lactonase YvrE
MASALAAVLGVWPAYSSTTAVWEMNTFQDFQKGRFTGISLSRDGRLTLAPQVNPIFSPDQPQIWAVAKASDGSLYLGTGHRGRLYKVDASGHGSLIWTAEQPEIFAVSVDDKGAVYAATSPDGRVYRIDAGKASEFFNPASKYIWSMVFAPDGALFVGTGDAGKIYRVTPDGKGAVYYESGQSHITSLAIDSQGRLLAGSEPNGILYRISAPNKAFVLYDANLPEIRSILPASDGSIYVAALGGSTARRPGTAYNISTGNTGVTVTAPATSVTVTDTQAGSDLKKPDAAKPAAAPAVTQPSVQPGATVFDVAGVEKSALYKVHPDNTVETLWSSKDEDIYDIAASDGRLIFSTDAQGRIYRLGADRKPTLIAQTGEGETTRLLSSTAGLIAATGDMGRIYRLEQSTAPEGTYESPVHDSNTVARWGRLTWRADIPAGTQLAFRTRAGNSARPDNTWSDWSEPLSDAANSLIKSPNARYIQWRAELRSKNGAAPSLDSVSIAYLPQNTPPAVRSVSVSLQAAATQKPSTQAASASSSSAFSITVTDTADAAPQTSAGTPTQTVSRGSQQQIQISWQADDPDGDRLAYGVYFRGEDEREWKLLRGNYYENTLALDSDILADGRYYFRVVASDRPSNPLNAARESEMVSSPTLIDNTPPLVTAGAPRRGGNTVDIDVDAADATSPLRRCEYSVDAGPWIPIEALDGVTDSPHEKYAIHIESLRPGEHLVVIRATDAANNAGLTKVVIR